MQDKSTDMEVNKLISLWLLWLSIVIGMVDGKFKSLSCSSFDQQLGNYSRCDIRALSLWLVQRVQIASFKHANGWRPILYNFTISVCKFLRRPYHIIAIIAFEYLEPLTNLYHTCPHKSGTSLRFVFPLLIKNNLKLNIYF